MDIGYRSYKHRQTQRQATKMDRYYSLHKDKSRCTETGTDIYEETYRYLLIDTHARNVHRVILTNSDR